jgi:Chromo (CHRromatin Organisation MOdifier) domain
LQQHYISIAREILKKSDEEHISKNSAQITEFAPNTFVLVQQHTTPETRLHTLWHGPMKVMKSLKGQYTLLDLTTLKEKEYHSTQLKEFIFNPNRVSPLDVARKDYLEFFIEEILHHTGNTNRLSTLNFKVKWQGYDDTYNSYEPWKNLRSTEQLHLYLIRQNLKHLIPKQHQASY